MSGRDFHNLALKLAHRDDLPPDWRTINLHEWYRSNLVQNCWTFMDAQAMATELLED